jgi:hypothetical protein
LKQKEEEEEEEEKGENHIPAKSAKELLTSSIKSSSFFQHFSPPETHREGERGKERARERERVSEVSCSLLRKRAFALASEQRNSQ